MLLGLLPPSAGEILLEGAAISGLDRRDAGSILVAEEFDIAAERNGADLPACIVTVVEAEQFRAKADGKGHDFDPTPAGHQEMAELVEKYDYG